MGTSCKHNSWFTLTVQACRQSVSFPYGLSVHYSWAHHKCIRAAQMRCRRNHGTRKCKAQKLLTDCERAIGLLLKLVTLYLYRSLQLPRINMNRIVPSNRFGASTLAIGRDMSRNMSRPIARLGGSTLCSHCPVQPPSARWPFSTTSIRCICFFFWYECSLQFDPRNGV